MARVGSTIDFSTSAWNKAGRATVLFDCMPQRFLKSGEKFVDVPSGGTIYNPTRYESKPLIRAICNGTGTIVIGDYQIDLSGIGVFVDIDSELQDCYAIRTSMNNKVTLSNGFPLLKSGTTQISFDGDIDSVSIAGRWFTV